jgi:MurNAc alpha-1-phosphate uridylyltransferase
MRAMILAAGRGERMGALTANRPKPLLEIEGVSLLARQLGRLAAAGIREAVINLSYRGDQIRAAVGDGSRHGLRIAWSQEPEPPLGTAGGIIQALPLLGREPFLLVNADVVCDFDVAKLAPDGGMGCLVLVPNPSHHPRGDFGLDGEGRLVDSEPRLTYSGISLLDPALFDGLPPGRHALATVFLSAIAARNLAGVLHEGLWFDVGTPERLKAAASALEALTQAANSEGLRGG